MSGDRVLPRYPVYIPSRGRSDMSPTAEILTKDGVPFRICVAPYEADLYRRSFGDHVLELPHNRMDIVAVRNWIRDHAESGGAEKHWQLDDNIHWFYRRYKAKRLYCRSGLALRACEDFTDRYSNVGLAGLNYAMFCPDGQRMPPFLTNIKVYSCTLVNHAMPYRWRGPYNDDTDLCLQALSGGWCTVSLNAFVQQKERTMKMKGGMTDANENSYQSDGRLRMARTLERRWPKVVETKRRFQRPQHVIKYAWQRFDTPLKLKEGVDLDALAERSRKEAEYGMELREVKPVKSERLRGLVAEYEREKGGDPG